MLCSLSLLALLALSTAHAGRPADNDGDGVKSNQDCNDNDPTVSVLNSCSECAPEPAEGCSGDPHASLSWNDYPYNCMDCHDDTQAPNNHFDQLLDSTHYKWVGTAEDMANGPGDQQGKLTNAVNSYCINIKGDWPVCGSCHVGRGERPDETLPGEEKANLSWALTDNADDHFDVHMNVVGPDLQCQDCHVFQNHKTFADPQADRDLQRLAVPT